jgi:hypothetical protein
VPPSLPPPPLLTSCSIRVSLFVPSPGAWGRSEAEPPAERAQPHPNRWRAPRVRICYSTIHHLPHRPALSTPAQLSLTSEVFPPATLAQLAPRNLGAFSENPEVVRQPSLECSELSVSQLSAIKPCDSRYSCSSCPESRCATHEQECQRWQPCPVILVISLDIAQPSMSPSPVRATCRTCGRRYHPENLLGILLRKGGACLFFCGR